VKIGLLIYGSLETLSGGYFYDRQLVEYLRARGDTVEIISLPWRNYAAHLSDNFRFRLPAGLDVLIQDELNHPSLLIANAAKHPYPVISLVHHLRSSESQPFWINWFYKAIEKQYLNSVDGFIFNSITTRNVVSGLVGNAGARLVAFPPTDRFGKSVPIEWVTARAQEAGPLRLIFLGNLIERKGLHTLLEAISYSPADFRLDVVGSMSVDRVYTARMRSKVRNLGLEDQVHFWGALDTALLVEKLKYAHVLAVPSMYEGFGIVYLEGMAFGLPAIGGAIGAASEIITPGETGFLINPGDARELATYLKSLVLDRSLLSRISLNALKRYDSQPDWLETAENIRQFLHNQINS
jgi:glycosyltransferase involved in cell wall biosynthesis